LMIASIFFTAPKLEPASQSASKWTFPATARFTCAECDETVLESAELDAHRRGSIGGNDTDRQRTSPPRRDAVRQTNCTRIRTIRDRESSPLLPTCAFQR